MDYWLGGPNAVDNYTWERRTYRLEGGHFRLVDDTAGQYERRNGHLELSNDLVCGR